MTCTAGGPYLPNSVIIITGNVTNTSGSPKNSSVNITVNSTNKVTTSDTNGSFYLTFSGFDVGNYSISGTSNGSGFNNATCSNQFTISSPNSTLACRIKTIKFNGTVIDSGSGNVINSGNVSSAIEGTNATGTAIIQSNGQFSVSVTGCLYYGTRYLVSNIFDDTSGRRGWFNFIYVPT